MVDVFVVFFFPLESSQKVVELLGWPKTKKIKKTLVSMRPVFLGAVFSKASVALALKFCFFFLFFFSFFSFHPFFPQLYFLSFCQIRK